jgi:hypothetical protein
LSGWSRRTLSTSADANSERARPSVAYRTQRLVPSDTPKVACTAPAIPRRLAAPSIQADRSLKRVDRGRFEAERERQVEDDLGIGRALDAGEQLRVDGEQEVPAQAVKAGEEAVVHEEPAAVAERVTVGLLHG